MITYSVPGDFATIADALAPLPSLFTEDVEIHASGSLPDPVTLTRFVSGGGDLRITGPATLGPLSIRGPVGVVLDGLTLSGGSVALKASYGSRLSWSALTLRDWSAFGMQLSHGAVGTFGAAGLLDVLGPGATGWGIHLVMGGQIPIWSSHPSGCLVRVDACQYSFALGFHAAFTHQGPGGSIALLNCSRGVLATDRSSWSTTGPLTGTNLAKKYEANSISYLEAVGTRSWVNCGAGISSQNSVVNPAGWP